MNGVPGHDLYRDERELRGEPRSHNTQHVVAGRQREAVLSALTDRFPGNFAVWQYVLDLTGSDMVFRYRPAQSDNSACYEMKRRALRTCTRRYSPSDHACGFDGARRSNRGLVIAPCSQCSDNCQTGE